MLFYISLPLYVILTAAVIFGAPERVAGEIANSAFCVDRRGNLAGVYRKTHLFGEERGAFVAGDELLVVDLASVKVGLLICFDVEFPEVARSLALAGVDLLVTISANMEPLGRDHNVFSIARALENGIPHLYVNQVGAGEEFVFSGGDHLMEAAPLEEVVSFSLNLRARSETKPEHLRPQYLQQLRSPLPVGFSNRR